MAISNTVSLETNFNVDPYYDDWDESKGFHRILFRPGLAVQARELTQMQTMQTNQLDRLSEHVFKEGSPVRGMEATIKRKLPYVKIRDADFANTDVDVTAFIGTSLTGNTSGVTAEVIDIFDGTEAADPNTKTIYIEYTNAGSNNTTDTFQSGEQITANSGATCNVITEGVQSTNVVGDGYRVDFREGIMFAKDHFIRVAAANTIVGRYSSTPSGKVGFVITETIVDSDGDATLLDPAQGAYNFAAPGANRLKLEAIISTKALNVTSQPGFIERLRIDQGKVFYNLTKPDYAVIKDYIAERTADESGDYLVRGMEVKVNEHLKSGTNGGLFEAAGTTYRGSSVTGNTNLLAAQVNPGKVYVQGFETEFLSSKVENIEKGTDVQSLEQISIPANYGNFVSVNELAGDWDVNTHDRVSLYDSNFNAVSNNTLSTADITGRTKLGEARVRAVEYASGTKGDAAGIYSLYLYDISMTANTFSNVRGINFPNSTWDGVADVVLTAGDAVLQETSFNRAIFNTGATNIRRITDSAGVIDNEYRFLKQFDVTIAADGTVAVATGDASETYPFSLGALNSTQERENFQVVLKATANSSAALETTAAKASGANNVTGLTSASSKYNTGDVIKLQGIANTFIISSIVSDTEVEVYGDGVASGSTSSATLFKAFQPGQVISLNGVGGDAAARSVNVDSATQVTIDLSETLDGTVDAVITTELKKIDGQEIAKVINEDSLVEINVSAGFGTSGILGPWPLGLSDGHKLKEVRVKTGNTFFTSLTEGSDVTKHFRLDTGMTDNLYDHAKLVLIPNSEHAAANGSTYLVTLDYFTHDTSSGKSYFSVDSYPIDDALASNTTAIQTAEIPIYKSAVTGDEFDLRNHIDIRPRVTDTANSVTTLTNISRNPALSTVVVAPAGGLRYFAPNEDFISDFEYYLGRKDRLSVDKRGVLTVSRGTPGLFPKTPPPKSDGLTLAIIEVAPFPSLPIENARKISTATTLNGRTDLANKITQPRQVRYTMKDIGTLKRRIENLEYYTSLSLLEEKAKNFQIPDSSGLNRFKNGILVDNFVGHSVGNVDDADYAISMDLKRNEIRPTFQLDNVDISLEEASSSNVQIASKDAVITILDASKEFTAGDTITQGGTTGTLTYQVDTKLYIEDITGTYTTTSDITNGTITVAAANVSVVATPVDSTLVTLPYTHTKLIEQEMASDTRNAAGLFWRYKGQINLVPEADYWTDTVRAADVLVDFNGSGAGWENLANAWGTTWQSWGNVWTGLWEDQIDLVKTSSVQTAGSSAVFQSASAPGQQLSEGEFIKDTSVSPFMRSREIQVTATGLKPSTTHFAFFDDLDVAAYCSPATSAFANTASEGSPLTSDANGNLYVLFRVPNDDSLRFKTGSLPFKLSSSPTNSSATTGSSVSFGSAQYTASGQIQMVDKAVVATRPPQVDVSRPNARDLISSTNNREEDDGDDGDGDPIAQTFSIDTDQLNSEAATGAFLTKADVYFQSKHATLGCYFEIREVDSSGGFITKRVLPFSKIKIESADINVSNDASKPTQVIFPTPIFLLNNRDYAMIVFPEASNPDTVVWVSRLGEDDLVTGNRITKQPFSGTLFASSNLKQWQPIQEEDLKFNAYFADFGTDQTGTAVFKNENVEYLTVNGVATDTFDRVNELVHGETTLNLSGALTANVGDFVVRGSANGEVTFNSGSTVRVKGVTLADKFVDATVVYKYAAGSGANTGVSATLNSQSTPTGRVDHYDFDNFVTSRLYLSQPSAAFVATHEIKGQVSGNTATIVSIDNLQADLIRHYFARLALQGTTIKTEAKLATSVSAVDTTYFSINENDDTVPAASRLVLSKSVEDSGPATESVDIRMTLTNSNNKYLSPAIDNERSGMFVVENIINNDATDENITNGGNAVARYITKTITLAEGQDAEDLKVLLTAFKPSTATVNVYVKILNVEDDETIDDQSWVLMTQSTSTNQVSDAENENDYREFEYTIPTANLTGGGGEVQYTNGQGVTFTGYKFYAIKIVLLSSNTAKVPKVRDFRAIALQI